MWPWSQLSVNLSAVLSGESRSLGWGWHMLSPALFFVHFHGWPCHPCCGYQKAQETHDIAVSQTKAETHKTRVNHRIKDTHGESVSQHRLDNHSAEAHNFHFRESP